MFSKILIANRGEIACRVIKTWAVTLGLAIMITAAGMENGYAREIPMWEGVTKNEEQKRADEALISAVSQQTNGDLEKGAIRAIQLGWKFIQQGDIENAIRRFNQGWLLAPQRGDVYWGFGIATGERGDPADKVQGYFRKAQAIIGDNARLFSDWGRIEMKMGNVERARTLFERAIDLDPKYREPHIGMMHVGLQTSDRSLADKHKKIVQQLDRK